MPRIKAVSEIKARWEFDQVIDRTVEMQIAKERLELRRDKAILGIRETFDKDIADLAEIMEINVLRAEKFAAEHRGELLPGTKKTAESTFAFFGWRTGNPTLVLLNRKWTWAKVIGALKAWADGRNYIVTKESVDKDAMKMKLDPERLASVGTRIEQSETFFIDPKRDPADPQRLTSGKAETLK
jgi:phage host-nuclease inhibitor protein Gam